MSDLKEKAYELLRQKEAQPTDEELDYRLTCSALAFILTLNCTWCQHSELSCELLKLFSFEENEHIKEFKKRAAKSMSSCISCIDSYHAQRLEWLKKYKIAYEEEALAKFDQILNDWDKKRLLSVFESADVMETNVINFAIYETLSFPYLLSFPSVSSAFCSAIEKLIATKKMLVLKKMLPGALLCLFHPNDAVREWSEKSCKNLFLSKQDNRFPSDALSSLIDRIKMAVANLSFFERSPSIDEIPFTRKKPMFLRGVSFLSYYLNQNVLGLSQILDFVKPLIVKDGIFLVESLRIINVQILKNCEDVIKSIEDKNVLKLFFEVCSCCLKLSTEKAASITETDSFLFSSSALFADCLLNFSRILKNTVFFSPFLQKAFSQAAAIRESPEAAQNYRRVLYQSLGKLCSDATCANLIRNNIDILSVDFKNDLLNENSGLVSSLLETFISQDFASIFDALKKYYAGLLSEICIEKISKSKRSLMETLCSLPKEMLPSQLYYSLQNNLAQATMFDFPKMNEKENGADLSSIWNLLTSWILSFKKCISQFLNGNKRIRKIDESFLVFSVSSDPDIQSQIKSISLGQDCRSIWIELMRIDSSKFIKRSIEFLDEFNSTLTEHSSSHFVEGPCNFLLFLLQEVERCDYDRELGSSLFLLTWITFMNLLRISVFQKVLRNFETFLHSFKMAVEQYERCKHFSFVFQKGSIEEASCVLFSSSWVLDFMELLLLAQRKDFKNFGSFAVIFDFILVFWICHGYCIQPQHALVIKRIVSFSSFAETDKRRLCARAEEYGRMARIDFDFASEPVPSGSQQKQSAMNEDLFGTKVSFQHYNFSAKKRIESEFKSQFGFFGLNPKERKLPESFSHISKAREKERLIPKNLTKLQQMRYEMIKDVKPPAHRQAHTSESIELSSSDTDEMKDFQDDLVAESKKLRSRLEESQYTSRQIKLIDDPNQQKHSASVRKEAALERQLKKARLAPDINRFHSEILKWDFHAVERVHVHRLQKIPTSFANYEEYFDVFEPLLLLECKAQIVRSKEEMSFSDNWRLRVLSVIVTSDFHDITFSLVSKEDAGSLSEFDLLYLEQGVHNFAKTAVDAKACPYFTCLVMNIKTTRDSAEVMLRANLKNSPGIFGLLREGTEFTANRVCNVITSNREYQSLVALLHYNLKQFVLNPKMQEPNSSLLETSAKLFMNKLFLNHSQAVAVSMCCHNPNPFTLIQGPPGTGKTSTIVAICSAFLSNLFSSSVITPSGALNSHNYLSPKILICAPSNAAVDEIVRRLVQGVPDINGNIIQPRVVRFGSLEVIHEDIKKYSLESIVDSLATSTNSTIDELQKEINFLKDRLESLLVTKDSLSGSELEDVKTKIAETKTTLWNKREQNRRELKKIDENKTLTRMKVLKDSQIICCTLSGSGHDTIVKLEYKFETVIIDEACQSVEPSSLIPLKYGCKRCILVGDPNQLPPTVLSSSAQDYSYEQSLFQRIQKNLPKCVFMLETQYRMHPQISLFPCRFFYDGRLKDAEGIESRRIQPWHSYPSMGPYQFFDIHGMEERNDRIKGSKSFMNSLEASCVVSLVRLLCVHSPDAHFSGRIGVITPYKEQLRELRRKFVSHFGRGILAHVEINTVDGFQGKEKDIIIVSCVRAHADKGLGFLTDMRRMNVALTRAKYSLYILGRAESLNVHSLWRDLIDNAKDRQVFVRYNKRFWDSIPISSCDNLLLKEK